MSPRGAWSGLRALLQCARGSGSSDGGEGGSAVAPGVLPGRGLARGGPGQARPPSADARGRAAAGEPKRRRTAVRQRGRRGPCSVSYTHLRAHETSAHL
eukprot:1130888-Alexandrium_andersonii.AAC.1